MRSWLGESGLFFADMFRHMVGKLTGVLSVVLGLAPVIFPSWFSGDSGILHNRWLWECSGALAFFLASRSAWKEQHDSAKAERAAKEAIEQKYFDERPVLGLTIHYSDDTADFRVEHLSGRPAANITADPILSLDGSIKLHFFPSPHLTGRTYEYLSWDIEQVHIPNAYPTSSSLWKKLGARGMLSFFTEAHPTGQEASYVMTIRFLDRSAERTQSFRIGFDPLKGATVLTLPESASCTPVRAPRSI